MSALGHKQSCAALQAPRGAAIGAVPVTDEVLKVQHYPLRVIEIAREWVQSLWIVAFKQDGVADLGRQPGNVLRVVTIFSAIVGC